MQNMEHTIRERAYHLWNDAGRPDGQGDAFWLTAQREILETSMAEMAGKPKAPKKPAKAKKAMTPPSKRKAA